MPIAVQFAATAVIWGSSFLFIRVGLDGLAPAQVALGRLMLGALTLAALAAARRARLPREPVAYLHLAVVAVLLCVVPFTLFAWAEQYVPSGTASVLNATTPLQTMLVAMLALPDERPTPPRLAGLAIGFGGVLVTLGAWHGVDVGSLRGAVGCLAATACYGMAFVYLRRLVLGRGIAPVTVAAVQVGLGAAIMAVVAPALPGGTPHISVRVALAMLGLGVGGTGLAYLWNTNVVSAWGATAASTVTYLTPAVGVVLGTAVLGEPLTWSQPLGALVVVGGILVSRIQPRDQVKPLLGLTRAPAGASMDA